MFDFGNVPLCGWVFLGGGGVWVGGSFYYYGVCFLSVLCSLFLSFCE
jgi:hypothetical protein